MTLNLTRPQMFSDAAVEQEAILIFEHNFYLKPKYLATGHLSRSECSKRISSAIIISRILMLIISPPVLYSVLW